MGLDFVCAASTGEQFQLVLVLLVAIAKLLVAILFVGNDITGGAWGVAGENAADSAQQRPCVCVDPAPTCTKSSHFATFFFTMEGVLESIDDQKPHQEGDDGEKTFSEVRRKRKREKGLEMDVTEANEVGIAPVKRPSFPPVAASTTLVSTGSLYLLYKHTPTGSINTLY